MIASSALGMASRNCSAMFIGLHRSSSPHTSSVGTLMFGSRSVVFVSAEDFAIRRKPKGWNSETTADISSLRSGEAASVKNSGTHLGTNSSADSEDSRKHLSSRFLHADSGSDPFHPA